MDSEEKALSLYSDFGEKLVRKRTSRNAVLQFIHIFCLKRKNRSFVFVQNTAISFNNICIKLFCLWFVTLQRFSLDNFHEQHCRKA